MGENMNREIKRLIEDLYILGMPTDTIYYFMNAILNYYITRETVRKIIRELNFKYWDVK